MLSRTMFCFLTHDYYPERISIYNFNTFVLVEPNRAKLCEWIFRATSFEDWKDLSERLLIFLDTVMPFLERVMGSFMSILKKIIDNTCLKKKSLPSNSNVKDLELIAESFKEEVIDKTSESIHDILYKAVLCYFHTDLRNKSL